MFYTGSSNDPKALQLKWFGLAQNRQIFLYIYEIHGGIVEIATDKKGNYLTSKLITDEYF